MEGTRAAGREPFIRESSLNPRTIWYGSGNTASPQTTSIDPPEAMCREPAAAGADRRSGRPERAEAMTRGDTAQPRCRASQNPRLRERWLIRQVIRRRPAPRPRGSIAPTQR